MTKIEIAQHNLKVAQRDYEVTAKLYWAGQARPSDLMAARDELERAAAALEQLAEERE